MHLTCVCSFDGSNSDCICVASVFLAHGIVPNVAIEFSALTFSNLLVEECNANHITVWLQRERLDRFVATVKSVAEWTRLSYNVLEGISVTVSRGDIREQG